MLRVDVLMAIFTLSSMLALAAAFGWVAGACAIAAFPVYSFSAHHALRRRQRLAPSIQPRTLLLLRVFGFDRRTQRLLDDVGQLRIEDFYCRDETWRMTVSAVAGKADAVLMDLCGFSQSNQGCIFELRQLIASVPVPQIVLLIDRTTDLSFLEQTVHDAWRAMPGDSPNRLPGNHRLRVLLASASHRRTLDAVMGLLCDAQTPVT